MIRKKGKTTHTNKATERSGYTGVQAPPTLYDQGKVEKAHKLALLGLTDKEIAEIIDININTFYLWRRKHDQFARAIDSGRVVADSEVAMGFYKKATGYEYEDTTVITNKVTEYDKNGKPVRSYNEPMLVPVRKHVPPDAWAANKWLALRQREKWSETQKVDHRHLVAGHIDLDIPKVLDSIGDVSTYSDDELHEAATKGLQKAHKQMTNGVDSDE